MGLTWWMAHVCVVDLVHGALVAGAEPLVNTKAEISLDTNDDVVQVFINTGEQHVGYWEFIDVQGV